MTALKGISPLSGISSVLGIPAGGAVLAGAIYSLAVKAEKEARKEALRDIARVIQDPSWARDLRPSAEIERLFRYAFGEDHVSWKCCRRSIYASAAFMLSFGIQFLVKTHIVAGFNYPWFVFQGIIICFIGDYFALWKTRTIIRMLTAQQMATPILILMDIIVSIIISCFVLTIWSYFLSVETGNAQFALFGLFFHELRYEMLGSVVAVFTHAATSFPFTGVFVLSTLMTSAWTVTTLLSSALLKLIIPLRVFINWFFPVEEHPIRAIGLVAGLLVWGGSIVVALI